MIHIHFQCFAKRNGRNFVMHNELLDNINTHTHIQTESTRFLDVLSTMLRKIVDRGHI